MGAESAIRAGTDGTDPECRALPRGRGARCQVTDRPPLLPSEHRTPLALVVALALALDVGVGVVGAQRAGVPVSWAGAFYDGHLYIEIAKSFPFPYSARGPDYLGHAPGYPALVALLRTIVPRGLANWGLLAMWATWLPAALAVGAFYLLCLSVGSRPLWPTLLFALANPRWLVIGGVSHPEGLAVLLWIGTLLAFTRGRPIAAGALLALASLTRFPAVLLIAPLAFSWIGLERRRDARVLAATGLAASGMLMLELYLYAKIPHFQGIWAAHRIYWKTGPTWPFRDLITLLAPRLWGRNLELYVMTYAFVLLSLLAVAVGMRPRERALWILPLSIATLVVFHASLSGAVGARDFTRLAVLAWPPMVLVLWRFAGERAPVAGLAAVCVAAGAFSAHFASDRIARSIVFQSKAVYMPGVLERLDRDRPTWLVFSPPRQPEE